MLGKAVFYLRVQDAKNRRYWHDSQNYDSMEELLVAYKSWLEEHPFTHVIFAKKVIVIPE